MSSSSLGDLLDALVNASQTSSKIDGPLETALPLLPGGGANRAGVAAGIDLPLSGLIPTLLPTDHSASDTSLETATSNSATQSKSSAQITSASSANPTTSASSATTTSSASSQSQSQSQSASDSAASNSASQSDTPPANPTQTPDDGSTNPSLPVNAGPSTVISTALAPGASQTGSSDLSTTQPKSFFDNKPLSISVITVASVLGLIFLVIVGTWAIRKRKRRNLEDYAAELGSDDYVANSFSSSFNSRGHGSDDLEKAAGGFGVIDKMEAVGVARHEGTSYGMGAGAAAPQRGATQRSATRLDAYNQPPAAVAQYSQDPYASRGYGQAQQGQGYAQSRVPVPVYDQQPRSVAPSQQPYYYDNRDYGQLQVQTQVPPASQQQQQISPAYKSAGEESVYGSHLPNPFEAAAGGAEPFRGGAAAYDFARSASPVPSQEFFSPPRTMQRKAPPAFLTLDTGVAPQLSSGPAPPPSAGSLSASPMQLAPSVNPANPMSESPQSVKPRRSSLMDPPTPTSSQGHGRRRSSSSRPLDMSIVPGPPPVAPPLPEQFGTSPRTPTNKQALKVINA